MSRKTPRRANPILCVGNPAFNPDEYPQDPSRQEKVREHLRKNDLYHAIVTAFGLPERDTYTYHAMTSVTLAQVQHVVSLGGANNLHAWYRAEDGAPVSLQILLCFCPVFPVVRKLTSRALRRSWTPHPQVT